MTGAYVSGSLHYGRTDLIDLLLHGESRAHWVVGNRRIGKTSLLRQLELLALSDARLIPLFWDMQGCNSFACLGRYLADGVCDHADRFEPLGLTAAQMKEEDALAMLTRLRRLAVRTGHELLLLCDETEVLINIARREAESMQRLHRQLTGGPGMRVVLTSTRQMYRMHDVSSRWPTSSFLAGFDMSQTLGSLDPAAARSLIVQEQAPASARVTAPAETIDAISYATNNHPLLLQLLCSRVFEPAGRLRRVCADDLQVDRVLAGFFEHDFRQLTKRDRQIVLAVGSDGLAEESLPDEPGSEGAPDLRQRLQNLERLGYLRRADGRLALGNLFLANWLSAEAEALESKPALKTSEAAMRAIFARQEAQDTGSLVAQLNARRARLVELETIRARELLSVTPQVLDEIEQLQTEVTELRRLLDRRRSS